MKPLVTVVPFSRDDVPRILNGAAVEKPAHVADFRRLQVLMQYGGIYLDTDHIPLRSFDDLRRCGAVVGRGPRVRVNGVSTLYPSTYTHTHASLFILRISNFAIPLPITNLC